MLARLILAIAHRREVNLPLISQQPERKGKSKPWLQMRDTVLAVKGWSAHHRLQVQCQGCCECRSLSRHLISWLGVIDALSRHTLNCLIPTFKLDYKSIHSSITMLYIK